MEFSLNKSLEILENTPATIAAMLKGLSEEWINASEGPKTWTAKEVLAHLIVCEMTGWLPRIKIILSDNVDKAFNPIDMQMHYLLAQNTALEMLILQFTEQRINCIAELKALHLQQNDFIKTGLHPKAGNVMLQEIIATWVAHDLTHIAQIARVMAKQNKELVGNFKQFLKILS